MRPIDADKLYSTDIFNDRFYLPQEQIRKALTLKVFTKDDVINILQELKDKFDEVGDLECQDITQEKIDALREVEDGNDD